MKTAGKLFVGLFLVLFFVEAILQIQTRFADSQGPGGTPGSPMKKKAMQSFVQAQIRTQWTKEHDGTRTYFEPPIDVFVNRGFEDEKRMKNIAEKAKLPASITATQQNFLRLNSNKETGKFTVHTNSLGFRGIERSIIKNPKTFRIVLLGSYPAFGHGVNDDETYAVKLENFLNLNFKLRHFEVWNGGRQSGTSIMGIARLENEAAKYEPDLILWDFGWVELYLRSDVSNSIDDVQRATGVDGISVLKALNKFCEPFRPWYLTCEQIAQKQRKLSYSDSIGDWQESMLHLKNWSKAQGVPVIFLRHLGVTIPEELYKNFDSPQDKFFYLSTKPALSENLTQAELDEFWSSENWISELGFTREQTAKDDPWAAFFTDAIQYNKFAYDRFGRFIGKYIIEHALDLNLGAAK